MALADRGVSSLPCRMPGQQRAHEGPFIPQHAAALVADAIGVDEIGIRAEQRPVLLLGGEAGKAEQGQGPVARALGRQEVAVMDAAMHVDQFHPPAAKAFESLDLSRIDNVLDDASDHGSA